MTQKQALDILKAGYNVYLTGSAGSGKTYLLEQFILSLKWRKIGVGVTASTGVAATHLSGMTIQSWAGIGIKHILQPSDIDDLLQRRYLHKRFRDIHVLIIDEVSMLSAATLESVDRILRAFKHSNEPFGGVQVVLCGDFFQLPPVNAGQTRSYDFVFKSVLWEQLDLKVCYLEKTFRQQDQRLISMLDAIRENRVTNETWEILKERFLDARPFPVTPTKLYTHNALADKVNLQELAALPGPSYTFQMETKGNSVLASYMANNCLAPIRLTLKEGAQVMFVKNKPDLGYVNGTMGKVVTFTEEGLPIVETMEGKHIVADTEDWEIEEVGQSVARISQIPLRLAWAITIHKSQGMTLDTAEIDLGKSFVPGLGYVALSRVRSLDGIKLRSINRTALSINQEIFAFDKQLKKQSDELSSGMSL